MRIYKFLLIKLFLLDNYFFFIKIFNKFKSKTLTYLVGGVIFLAFSGCNQGNLNISGDMENVEDATLLRIKDIPFVKLSKIDVEKSLILGEGKTWSGQIVLEVPEPKPAVFNFYVNNIENFGWKEQTTIRGETSLLNYLGANNRVIIISVREKRFNSSEVLISVSPYAEEFENKVSEYINDQYLDIKDWQQD